MKDFEDTQALADATAKSMYDLDSTAKHMGMDIKSMRPGGCVLTLRVEGWMINGHGICHGGIIFTLADTAFAYACNSHNQRVVALHCSITFLAPGKSGETLKATAKETVRNGRNGIYDIEVHNEVGDTIAHFRGNSRIISGTVLEKSGTPKQTERDSK